MLKLTKTGIGLLTRQYRSVLKKCWLINVGAWLFGAIGKTATTLLSQTLRGTLKMSDTEIFKVLDGLSEKRVFKTKLITTTTTIGLAVAGVMLPTRVMADEVVNYNNETWSNYGYYIKIIPGIANVQIYANEHTTIIDEGGLSTVYGDYVAAYRWNGLSLRDVSGDYKTQLNSGGFKLNGSDTMTGITHNTTVAANASSTVAKLVSESTLARSLNNYYRKNKKSGILGGFEEGKKGNEIGDNFSKFRAINGDFATNNGGFVLKNDSFLTNNGDFVLKNGDFATKNLSRFGAFSKCEKACSRPSERFPASMEKNSVFEQYSRSARGTFLFVSQTHKNVLDNFSKLAANDNFATTTFLRAI